jgi:alpha-1,6-mannosyltransferase
MATRRPRPSCLGLPASTRLLVFAGRPAKEKNIDALVDAAALLGPDYHLLLISAGLGVRRQDNITALPYVRDPRALARLMASADAFVHANDQEPFGLIVLEAMACGLPLVGPASGGFAELADSEVGEMAERADAEGLAAAVRALFERDLAAVSRAARARAVGRYGWDHVFTGLCSLYAGLTGAPAFAGAEAATH